jgi:hypothetical protein
VREAPNTAQSASMFLIVWFLGLVLLFNYQLTNLPNYQILLGSRLFAFACGLLPMAFFAVAFQSQITNHKSQILLASASSVPLPAPACRGR